MEETQTSFQRRRQENQEQPERGRLAQQINAMREDIQTFRRSMNIDAPPQTFERGRRRNSELSRNERLKMERRQVEKQKKKEKSRNPKMRLGQIMKEMRIKLLVENFIKKMSRNNVERNPVEFDPFSGNVDRTGEYHGIQINHTLLSVIFFISILNTFAMIVIFSMSVLFEEALKSQGVTGVQTWGVVWLLIQMGINFVKVSYGKGYHKLEKLRDIAWEYFTGRFGIDLACWLGLIIDLCFDSELTLIARSVLMLKSWDCLMKIQALETKLINTSYKENCWGLVKIFLTNFIIAHFLAVILIMISWLNTKKNWLSKVDAMEAPWIEQYCWAYYWGTTIMFTVGFGDISAVNHKEAMFIVVIQAFTCIYLAYNISCVGTYITNIHAENVEKQKKQKTLKHLSDKNNISEDLTAKINNYIEECANIKKNFNIEEDSAFISSLPSSIKTSFLRESNKKIFQNLPFFSTLTESTLLQLAEKIEMSITHPEQIIEKKDDKPRILILKQGSVAFCSKIRGSKYNNTVIDEITIKEGDKPTLLSLQFIYPQQIKYYQIHSKQYSILYSMQAQELNQILKSKNRDYEYFFFLKDKSKHLLDEFEFKKCQYCSSNHLSTRCPKLHYMPLAQEVLFKFFNKFQVGKNERTNFVRGKTAGNVFSYFESNKVMRSSSGSQSFSSSSGNSFKVDSLPEDKNTFEAIKRQTIHENKMETLISRKTLKNESAKKSETGLIEDAVGKVKNQLMYYLNDEYNWFWNIQSDVIKDYQYYFHESNPKKLKEIFQTKQRKTKSFIADEVQFSFMNF